MTELYVYDLSFDEEQLAKSPRREAQKDYLGDRKGFLRWEIALQKAWINLIATDWPQAKAWKERDLHTELFDYETQEFTYQGAVNRLRMLENRMKRLKAKEDRKLAKSGRKN